MSRTKGWHINASIITTISLVMSLLINKKLCYPEGVQWAEGPWTYGLNL